MDKDSFEYQDSLTILYDFLSKFFNKENKTGFALLIMRAEDEGCVDLVTNLKTDSVKKSLKDILETIEKQ